MKSYKARGVVLHTVKYSESSVIVYMLTDTMGRQTYLVQGVRSTKGKGNKGSLFQPMFVLDFVGYESPKMQMHRMKDVRSAFTMTTLPFDIRKSTISLFMAEVLYRLVRESEPGSPLFDFVCGAVYALDVLEEGTSNFHLWFLVRLSQYLGIYPGNDYITGGWFDIREGLFTPILPLHRLAFDRDTTRILNDVMEAEVSRLESLKLSRDQRSGFMKSIINYFGYHLDSANNINSVDILREVF